MCCKTVETHPGVIWFGERMVCISKMIPHCLATITIYRFSRYTVTFQFMPAVVHTTENVLISSFSPLDLITATIQ